MVILSNDREDEEHDDVEYHQSPPTMVGRMGHISNTSYGQRSQYGLGGDEGMFG